MHAHPLSLYLPSCTNLICDVAPAEKGDTLPLFQLYPYAIICNVLCGLSTRINILTSFLYIKKQKQTTFLIPRSNFNQLILRVCIKILLKACIMIHSTRNSIPVWRYMYTSKVLNYD